MKLTEADITFKARGKSFQSIKIICTEEKESCTMKVQKVVFGDFTTIEFPKNEFVQLIAGLSEFSIPFPGFSDGKTGDQFQLDIQSGENAIYLKWFGDSVDEQWAGVLGFVDKLIALKEKYVGD